MHKKLLKPLKITSAFMAALFLLVGTSAAAATSTTSSTDSTKTNTANNNDTVYDTTSRNRRNTASVQYTLDTQLHEHSALVTPALTAELLDQPEASALMDAMDTNAQSLATTVNRLYPGTHDQFLQLWHEHMAYYQQYLTAAKQNNPTAKQQAKQNLTQFVDDLTNLLTDANDRLNSTTLSQQLTAHVNRTLDIIDALVARDYADASRLSHHAFEQTSTLAQAMAPYNMVRTSHRWLWFDSNS